MTKIIIRSILAVMLVLGLFNSQAFAATVQQPIMSVISIDLPVYKDFAELSDSSKQSHLADLNYNEKVTVISYQGYAAQIQFQLNGTTKIGWVHKAYLSSSIMNQTWLVKKWRNLHTDPNTSSLLVQGHETVPDNTMVHVLAYNKESNFYQIQLEDGTTGWIKGSYLNENDHWFDYKAGRNVIPYEFVKAGTFKKNLSVFTPLNTMANVTANQINKYIDYKTNGTKTLMTGMGSTYLKAQKESGLNAIYLLAHSGLESKWGSSAIVSNNYNYYGIHAIDLQPTEGAYNYLTPANGVIAGSIFISQTYVNRDQFNVDYPFAQPTLDNMRFNDNLHQYSTDEAWAGKISNIIKEFNDFTYTKGWKKIAGKWYYNNGDGTYKTGWLHDGGKWYYFNSSGAMKTGWLKINNQTFYLNPTTGAKTTSAWVSYGGKKYYFNVYGVMQQGWLKIGNYRYYFDKSTGAMKTGWVKISKSWYYFYSNGKMAHDTKIGKYRLGHNGTRL